jgi:hypothetical protein
VKTISGATAMQIVYSSHCGSRDIEHVGSAQGDVQLGVPKAAARQRMAAGQGELELALSAPSRARRAPAAARGHSTTGNASRDRL